jgi:hypothetical protein
LQSPDPEPVQEIVDAAMRRQKARALTITLPKSAFVMLYKVMEDVGHRFESKDFNPTDVCDSILLTLAKHDINATEEFPVTLSVADWVNVMSITRMVHVQNLSGEEFLYDLRAYIEGALKQVGPG